MAVRPISKSASSAEPNARAIGVATVAIFVVSALAGLMTAPSAQAAVNTCPGTPKNCGDTFGYVFVDVSATEYSYVHQASFTKVAPPAVTDWHVGAPMPSGFAFKYYGTAHTGTGSATDIYIGENGYTSFSSTAPSVPTASNGQFAQAGWNGVIGPGFVDRAGCTSASNTAGDSSAGAVYYGITGTGSNRVYNVEFDGMAVSPGGLFVNGKTQGCIDFDTFEAKFFEGTDWLEYQIPHLDTLVQGGRFCDRVVVGIQSPTGSSGLNIDGLPSDPCNNKVAYTNKAFRIWQNDGETSPAGVITALENTALVNGLSATPSDDPLKYPVALPTTTTKGGTIVWSGTPTLNQLWTGGPITGTYSPPTEYAGPDSFTYKVYDDFDSTQAAPTTITVNLDVKLVNRAPSFALPASPDQASTAGAATQTVTGFASSIQTESGVVNADEAAQKLAFTVTNSNNALFATQPTISPSALANTPWSGTLTYKPHATNCSPTPATVSVTLKDDGTTNNGGADTSPTKTFAITVACASSGPPEAPALSASLSPVPRVDLSWNAPSNGGSAITGYKLYKSASAGIPGTGTPLFSGTATSANDLAVAVGNTFYYAVRATNANGDGPLSNEVRVDVVGLPTAPVLSGNGVFNDANLAWSAPSSDGGKAVTNYQLFRATGACGTPNTLVATVGNLLATTDPGTYAQTYCYAVAAVNANGVGPKSNFVTVTLSPAPSTGDVDVNAYQGNLKTILLPSVGGTPRSLVACPLPGDVAAAGFGDTDNLVSYTPTSASGIDRFHYYITDGKTSDPSGSHATCTPANTHEGRVHIQPNEPPLAAFSASSEKATSGQAIILTDASGDAEGPIATWRWDFGDGQFSTAQSPQHAFQAPGSYAIRLTVTDALGAKGSATKTIVVEYPPSSQAGTAPLASSDSKPAPVPDAGVDQAVVSQAHVILHGLANNVDHGYYFKWLQPGGTKVNLTGMNPAAPEFDAPALAPGTTETLVFTLQVSDGIHTSQTDQVKVVVSRAAEAPVASAGAAQVAVAGETVQLLAVASDPNGLHINYTWTQIGGTPVALMNNLSANPTFMVPADASGETYLFRVEASNGHLTTVDTVQVLAAKAPVVAKEQSVLQPAAKSASIRNAIIARSHQNSPAPVAGILGLGLLLVAARRRRL